MCKRKGWPDAQADAARMVKAKAHLRSALSAADCPNCDSTGWVCENHRDQPWDGTSDRDDACGCGAGAPCATCVPKGEWPPLQPGETVIWSIHSGDETVH